MTALLPSLLLLASYIAQARVIVSDDFEAGLVKSPTTGKFGDPTGFWLHAPAPRLRAHLGGVDPAGKSGIFAHSESAASGTRSIRIQNAPGMTYGHLPALSWWLHNETIIRSGTVQIGFDLLIPEEGGNSLTVLARGFKGPNGYSHQGVDAFSLNCAVGTTSLNDQQLKVSPGWTRHELSFPIGPDSGVAQLRVVDHTHGEQTVKSPLAGPLHQVDWIGFLLPGETDTHLLLDNLSIVIDHELPIPPVANSATPAKANPGRWTEAPATLLEVFPESVVRSPQEKMGETVHTSSYSPSGSLWQHELNERWVFHRELQHVSDGADAFSLRIGKGGQLYSLRGAFGESVPPSFRSDGPSSPWNDEIWQFVAVCGKYNDTLLRNGPLSDEVKKRIEATGFPRLHLFIHNSGAYMEGDLSAMDNLYCPLLGAAAGADGRSYRTVNWGLIPWNTPHRSPLLYYVQTRDAGEGVIEITYVVHNFSVRDDVVFDHLNAPWGGTRASSLPFHYVSTPEGELQDRVEVQKVQDMWEKPVDVRATGGWNLSCASEAPDSPSLALVFGRDRHLETELAKVEAGEPHCQFAGSIYRDASAYNPSAFRDQDFRERPENSWRNYDVAVVIPKFRLAPGTTIWYRSYLVVNRRDRAIELAKSLVDKVDYGLLTFDPAETPLVSAQVAGSPAFQLFAKPVPGSKPLFLIENATTGREVVTTDMYTFFDKEKLDWNLPPEHPDADYYNNAYAYRLEKHNSRWHRLLGYACVDKPEQADYVRLSDVLPAAMLPETDTYHLDLWVRGGDK